MATTITRGQFLRGALAAGAGVGAMGLFGCSPSSSDGDAHSESAASVQAEPDGLFDSGVVQGSPESPAYEADIVVVGGGAAGMAVAATAAEEGLNVVLVEANSKVGGTTQFAEGIAGVATDIQKAAGNNLNVQDLVNGELEFSNYVADARLIRDFLNGADENIEWLQGMGVEFYPDVINVTQHLYVGQGAGMIEKILAYCESLGVVVLTDTVAKKLYMENDAVSGIACESAEGAVDIKAPVVVLACGGYIQNDAMVDELQRFSHDRVKITANPGHNGEQMNMAYSAGADQSGVTLMHFIWAALDSFDLHSEISTAACNEGYFWVDQSGRRFCNESLVTNPSCIDNIILNQKRAISILTDAEAERLATEGCTVGWGSYIFAGSPMENLKDQLAQAVQDAPEGFYYGATVEELAEAAGLDAAVLRESIVSYNEMVASNNDVEFGKTAPFLHEVPVDGPFYAFDLKCSAFCTMGGIRINRQNEILNEDFEAIPGLYCAGVDCSGLQGTTYCMGIGGGAQGYAVYSGRNSARCAKAYLGK